MKRVLLSGATGFLGRNLLAALQKSHVPLRALLRPTTARATVDQLRKAGVELVFGDVADPAGWRAALPDVSHVFHLAGKLLVPAVPDTVYEHVHIAGTRALLQACAESGSIQRIVYCSTTGVLGSTGPHPAAETAPLRPSNIYERSKAEAETIALAAAAALPLTVVRPALVYGPGDLHLLGWFRAIQRGYYLVVGSGASLLHPIYIDDLVTGMLAAACTPAAKGRIYHLVGQAPLPIGELATAIATALGTRLPPLRLPFAPTLIATRWLETLPGLNPARLPLTSSRLRFMTESRSYSGVRARCELAFRPCVSLDEGLQRTVTWYRQEKLLR